MEVKENGVEADFFQATIKVDSWRTPCFGDDLPFPLKAQGQLKEVNGNNSPENVGVLVNLYIHYTYQDAGDHQDDPKLDLNLTMLQLNDTVPRKNKPSIEPEHVKLCPNPKIYFSRAQHFWLPAVSFQEDLSTEFIRERIRSNGGSWVGIPLQQPYPFGRHRWEHCRYLGDLGYFAFWWRIVIRFVSPRNFRETLEWSTPEKKYSTWK